MMVSALLELLLMPDKEPLIPKHGGYRNLKSFQVAQLVYDVTVRFCDRYIGKRSRTHDQMVQAARNGVQNIAEGSQAAGTSKKTRTQTDQCSARQSGRVALGLRRFSSPACPAPLGPQRSSPR